MFTRQTFHGVFVLFLAMVLIMAGCCLLPPPTPNTYTITATAGSGGGIAPTGAISIAEGASQTFTITPNEGYQVSDVLIDGVSVGAVTTYLFSNIQEDHSIQALFVGISPPVISPVYYTITATAGTGGSIDPAGTVKVKERTNQSFTITPYTCYQIADILLDGISVGAVDTLTLTKVKKNHTIFVSFSARKVINITTSIDYDSIQTAIDASNVGDTIIVCPGIYEENLVFNGKHITVKSMDTSDPAIVDATIIDGGGSGSVVLFTDGDTSILEGFSIQNGYYYIGGGIHIYNSSPTITGNTITNNKAITNGGGIFMDASSAVLTGNTITKNEAEKSGGGIYMSYCTPSIIEYNTISGNKATEDGGGIYLFESDSIVSDNSITDNDAVNGGGINVFFSSTIIAYNLITSNTATNNGGGINVTSYSHPTINHNSINYNTTTGFGGGIYVSSSGDLSMCDLLPDIARPAGWGSPGDSDYRNNIPIDNIEPAEPLDGPAGNNFSGNRHGDPSAYTEGAHVYFKTD